MNATPTAELMRALGAQAKSASAAMAKASSAQKNLALRQLAKSLRAQTQALQAANAIDLSRARAAGLAEPLVDRLSSPRR